MKKTLLTAIGLTTSLLLNGCGSDNPEEVAREFAIELTEANIEGAKKLSSNGMDRTFQNLVRVCNNNKLEKLSKDTKQFLNSLMSHKSKDDQSTEKQKTVVVETAKKLKESLKELKKEEVEKEKEFKEKYGSINKTPRKELQKFIKEYKEKVYILSRNTTIEMFKTVDIKADEDIIDVMAQMAANREMKIRSYNPIIDAAEEVLKRNPIEITEECISSNTDFGFIEDINVLETIERSPDKIDVRLEFIDKNDKSSKVTVEVEKIKEEWKVSEI